MILFLSCLIWKTISVSFQKSFLGPGVWPGWGQPIIFQLLGGLQLGTGSWPLSINKPTAPLLSLPNMDNYTATRTSGQLLLWAQLWPFSLRFTRLLKQPSLSKSICGHFCGNFFWQGILSISLSPSIRLLFAQPLTTMGCSSAPSAISKSECPNPAAQGSNNMQ